MDVVLGERAKQVLRALIQGYIARAEPIGSRTISRQVEFNVSPATVRNTMADLEEMGFLWQPHTSAGRVPTEKAFRFYVDCLLKVRRLGRRERERAKEKYLSDPLEVENLLKQAAQILSSLSDYIGVVVAPSPATWELKQIQFIRLGEGQILVILVSHMGNVEHKVITDTDGATQDELDKASRYLCSELSGLTLFQMRQRILAQMQEEKVKFDALLDRALRLGAQAVSGLEETRVYLEGKLNILKEPEFADIERMRAIFMAFEEKSKILTLLDRSLKTKGKSVLIGSEMDLEESKDLSLITSNYSKGERVLGTLGVIGPTRMNYSRAIAVVDFVSELMGELLEE